jgi:hypothetical protein
MKLYHILKEVSSQAGKKKRRKRTKRGETVVHLPSGASVRRNKAGHAAEKTPFPAGERRFAVLTGTSMRRYPS